MAKKTKVTTKTTKTAAAVKPAAAGPWAYAERRGAHHPAERGGAHTERG